jgi:hypothetical protein
VTVDEAELTALSAGLLFRFADWPNEAVPKRQAGVYTVWRGDQLLYAGMAGKLMKTPSIATDLSQDAIPPDEPKVVAGLWSRLNSHASGRRSGDQFCVYVCDRFVVPDLSPTQRQQLSEATLSLDHVTKNLIRDLFAYRFVVAANGADALALERRVREGALVVGRPYLNPSKLGPR